MDPRYSQFHDLTHLLEYYKFEKYVRVQDYKMYKSKINKYINQNLHIYKEHDVVFIGSTYESRQYYGFSKIVKKRYLGIHETFEHPSEAFDNKGTNYMNALCQMKDWYNKVGKDVLAVSCDFEEAFFDLHDIVNQPSISITDIKHLEDLNSFSRDELINWIGANSDVNIDEYIKHSLQKLVFQIKTKQVCESLK